MSTRTYCDVCSRGAEHSARVEPASITAYEGGPRLEHLCFDCRGQMKDLQAKMSETYAAWHEQRNATYRPKVKVVA